MGEGVIKEGRGGWYLASNYIDLGKVLIVGGKRIHQSESWYYLGPFQTSKVEFFMKIVFGYKSLTCFCKELQLRCLTGSIRHFQ